MKGIESKSRSPGMKGFGLIFLIIWTCCIAASLGWNIVHQRNAILSMARIKADLSLKKDIIYRKWLSSKGGAYVPVSTTAPNPYLKVPHRDVVTVEGQYLTLVNPAYMTRQVNEMAKEAGFDLGHITSLKPIRPENAPDDWEKKALRSFNKGVKEVRGIDSISGGEYFRLMRPFIVESSCLKCHAVQGYKIGDIRGGISSSISMEPLYAVERHIRVELALAHCVIWILGIAGIAFAANRLSAQMGRTRASERQASNESDRAGSYLNIAAEIILSLDEQGSITLLNDSGHRLLGYERGELIGKNWFDTCLPEKAREEITAFFGKLKRGEVDMMTREGPVMLKDGTEKLVLWHNTVLRDDNGLFTGTLSSGEDITERRRADTALRQSEEKYRGLFESSRDAIMTLEPPSWAFTSGNPATTAMFRAKSAEVFISMSPGDLSPERQPDGRASAEKSIEMIETAMREGSHLFEWTHKRIDGEEFPATVLLTRVELEGKRFLQATVHDITERKRAENELAKTLLWQEGVSSLLQSLLAQAPLAAKLLSITDGIVKIFGADFCRIWITRPGDLCERGCVHAEVSEGPHVCRYRDRCLHLLASSGRYTHIDGTGHRRVPFGCYKIGLIASGEEHRFLTNDVQNDPGVHNHEWARELGLVSFAGYQLRVPGWETMGVLALFAKHRILPIEDALLDGISSAVGSVVQQAVTEDALRESEERYVMVLGAVNDGFWDWAIPTGDAFFSPIYYAILGYEDREFPASYATWRLLIHPEDIDRVEHDLLQSIESGKGFNIDLRMKMKSGEWRWVTTRGKTVEWDNEKRARRIVGTLTDIAGRKHAEEHIRLLLSEKELLLKEVHHRIKNNMTMIANLLSLQAARLSEPGGVKALNESRNRVMSMAAMYDILFRTTDFRNVHVNEYIGRVIDGITASLPAMAGVTLEKRIDDFVMDTKVLFPVSIIINELVTNAYKYAFPGGRRGTIAVSMSRLPENRVEISVCDDGAGIPEPVDINGQSGFGMKLVNLLVQQIEGTLECVRGGGTMFRIIFEYSDSPPDPPEGTPRRDQL